SLTNSNLELKNMFGQFMKMNTFSSLSSGALSSNTITNPKEDLKGITTRSGVAYKGPTIPTTSSSPTVVEREPEMRKDMVQPSTKNILPLVVQTQVLINEAVVKPTIPYPSRVNKQKLRKKDDKLALKFLGNFISNIVSRMLFCICPIGQTSSLSYNDAELINRIEVIDIACVEYSQEVLGFSTSGNSTPSTEPIVSTSSPTLTPFGDSDFLLEKTDAFLAIEDESISL
nr:reverse transcriptase domain-containing protein [Tanacetum cinerariifolium]